MKVKAAPGVRVPMDGAPRKYITDDAEMVVDDTIYYRRRIADGDLLVVPDTPARPSKTPPAA